MSDREHIQIYTRAWGDDAPVYSDTDEKPTSSLECRVFIDGKELIGAISATIHASSDFTTVTLEVSPGQLEWIPLREDEWKALGK